MKTVDVRKREMEWHRRERVRLWHTGGCGRSRENIEVQLKDGWERELIDTGYYGDRKLPKK